jgi:uncharacterized protein
MLNRRVALGAVVATFAACAAVGVADEPGAHEQAARELYRMIGGDRLIQQASDAMLVTVRSNPALAPYEDVVKEWFTKVIAGSHIEDEMAKAYADAFSEKELRELIAFYQSPVGQKALDNMPSMMRRGAEIGARLARENADDLEAMIAKRKKELEAIDKAKP